MFHYPFLDRNPSNYSLCRLESSPFRFQLNFNQSHQMEKNCISIRPPFLRKLLVPLTLLASNYLGETCQNWPLHPYRKPDEKSFTRSNRANPNFPNFPFKRLFSRVTRHPKPPFKIVTERSRTIFHPFWTATPIFHPFFHSLPPSLPTVRQNPSPLCDTQKRKNPPFLLSISPFISLPPSFLFLSLRSFFLSFFDCCRLLYIYIYIRSIRLFPTDTFPVLRSLFSHGVETGPKRTVHEAVNNKK